MAMWVSCTDGLIPADVVRWEETAWERRGRRGKAVNVARLGVTAEVLSADGEGWLQLLVRASAVVSEKTGRVLAPLTKDTEIRRKRSTVARGTPERLLWSDESARAAVVGASRGPDRPRISR
jgi:hypothetical protein